MTPAELARAAWIMAGFIPPRPSDMDIIEPRFRLGRTYATAAATRWAQRHGIDLGRYLRRHHCGDWGDLDTEDKMANEDALKYNTRIISAYEILVRKIYIVTEADRSMTTILFLLEYRNCPVFRTIARKAYNACFLTSELAPIPGLPTQTKPPQ
jgi:hypothetical protein